MFDKLADAFGDVVDTFTSIPGQLFSARQTEENQRRAIRNNHLMQQADHTHQWNMRSTAYQDMTRDLKKAGLNPMLAVNKQGIGGSSAGLSSPAPGVSDSMSSASAAHRQARTQEKLAKEQVQLVNANVGTAKALTAKHAADAKLTNRKAALIKPGSDVMSAVGDVTGDASSSARSKYKDIKQGIKKASPSVVEQARKAAIAPARLRYRFKASKGRFPTDAELKQLQKEVERKFNAKMKKRGLK